MSSIGVVLLLLAALVCNAAANILVKYGMLRRARLEEGAQATGWMTQFIDPYFLLGVLFFALNLFAYSLALKHFRLSIAYPVMVSGGYAIILLVSWFVFREKLSPAQFSGVAMILVGLWLAVR